MKTQDKAEFEEQNIFGAGSPNDAYAQYFVGQSFLNPLTDPQCGVFLANVTFEPGCRNNWHIHHARKGGGQILVCTAGEGWYQEAGKPAVSLVPGTVITIPRKLSIGTVPKRTAGSAILPLKFRERVEQRMGRAGF